MKREDIIPLSQNELSSLMKVSDGRPIHCTFPGGDLIWKSSRWALPILAEWRGLTFSDGAGI